MTMPMGRQGPPQPRQMMGQPPMGAPPGQSSMPDMTSMLQQLGGGQGGQPQSPTAMQGLTADGANAQQLNPATEAIQNIIQRLLMGGGAAQEQMGGQTPPVASQGGFGGGGQF